MGPHQSQGCADLRPEVRLGVRKRWGAVRAAQQSQPLLRACPTLGELYGISALVHGSSALVPEQGLAWDLGARWEAWLGPVWAYLDAFGFARHVSDLIAYRRSSLGAVQPYNVGSARVLGAEFEAGAQFAEHARATLGFDRARSARHDRRARAGQRLDSASIADREQPVRGGLRRPQAPAPCAALVWTRA